MKKIACCVVCVLLLTQVCACSIMPKLPSSGIWYCEELKITVEFVESDLQKTVVNWQDSDIEYSDLDVVFGYDGEMLFFHVNEDGGWLYVYDGFYKYKNDELIYDVFQRINPDDPNGDPFEVDERYVFTQIDDYAQVKS